MTVRQRWLLIALLVATFGLRAAARADAPDRAARTAESRAEAEGGAAERGTAAEGAEADKAPHPVLTDEPRQWPGVLVMFVILPMFLLAAVIGPIVWAETPQEVPQAHSHDEPPGASEHHGPGGTLQPDPDYGPHGPHAGHH